MFTRHLQITTADNTNTIPPLLAYLLTGQLRVQKPSHMTLHDPQPFLFLTWSRYLSPSIYISNTVDSPIYFPRRRGSRLGSARRGSAARLGSAAAPGRAGALL